MLPFGQPARGAAARSVSLDLLILQVRVKGVPQSVAQEIEGEDDQHYGDTGRETAPGRIVQILSALVDHEAPGSVRRLNSEPQKAQAALREDGGRNVQCEEDDQCRDAVGEDVPQDDPRLRDTDGAGGRHVYAASQSQGLRAHDAGNTCPAHE